MGTFTRIACFFLTLAGTAFADQTNPELPALFERLKETQGAENRAIQTRIWAAWYIVPSGLEQDEFDQAMMHLMRGDSAVALDSFERLASQAPNFAEVHNQIAIVHFALGDNDLSIAAIFRTLRLEPNHFGALAGLAQIFFRQGEFTRAIEAGEAALAINPHMPGMEQLIDTARRELGGESA